jgi:fatty acid desaturase
MGFYPNLMRLSPRYQRAAQINLTFNAVLYSSIYTLSENLFVTLLMFIAPFSATLLNKLLAKAQHHNLDGFSNDGALKFSRTLSLPKFLSFLYANMNYHAEHHFSPATPYYHLPELHKILSSRNLITSQPFLYFLRSELKWNDLKNDR